MRKGWPARSPRSPRPASLSASVWLPCAAPEPKFPYAASKKPIKLLRQEQITHRYLEDLHTRARKVVEFCHKANAVPAGRRSLKPGIRHSGFVAPPELSKLDSAGRLPQKRSVLAVSEGRFLLEVIEGSTEAHLMRFAKGLLPDMTKPPAEPVITSGRSSIHPKIRVPRGGGQPKARTPMEERRISFGRHTKLGYGGREIADVTEGGRRLTKEESAAALQELKNAHNKDLENYHARRSHLQDKVNNYRDHAQEHEDLAERAEQYNKERQRISLQLFRRRPTTF